MKVKKLVIHIGYPKTGTTTFQENVFPNLNNVVYLNQFISNAFLQRIFYSRENSFRLNSALAYNELREIIKTCGSDKVYLISNESFTSYGMFFRSSPKPMVFTVDPNAIANKLYITFYESGLFDKINILISLRNQLDLIKSMYAQTYNRFFSKYRNTNSFSRFVDYALVNSENMIVDTLQYDLVVEKYQKLFGEHNVLVLLFEELTSDQKSYCQKISRVMLCAPGVIEGLISQRANRNNKRLSDDRYLVDRVSISTLIMGLRKMVFKNQSFGLTKSRYFGLLNKINIGPKELRNVSYSEQQTAALSDLFSKGNSHIDSRLDLGLYAHGYPIEKKEYRT